MSQQIEHIKQLIKGGQRKKALGILAGLLKAQPNHEEAWWLLSFALVDPERKIYALQRVLKLNPRNVAARRRLAQLQQAAAPSVSPPIDRQPVTPVIIRQQPASRAMLSTRVGRIWAAALSVVFIITITTAFLLSNAMRSPQLAAAQVAPEQPLIAPHLPTDTASTPQEIIPFQESPAEAASTAPPTSIPAAPIEHEDAQQAQAPAEEVIGQEPPAEESAVETQPEKAKPVFDQFVDSVTDGNANQIVGVFVENRFSLKVVGQPPNNLGWITSNLDETTDFEIVRQTVGNDGLIAHNYLAGALYFDLEHGDIAQLIMGDGSVIEFEVFNIEQYQALSPNSPYSDFINLDNGENLSASDLFYRVYGGNLTLTFQTCIDRNSLSTWGRIFVIGDEF